VVVHAHQDIWKERGLLTSKKRETKQAKEVLGLLEAVLDTEELAIVHCPGIRNRIV
jgi:hypothetical protein